MLARNIGANARHYSGRKRPPASTNFEGLMIVIPGWSEGPDPESRDSGFDASRRPGMTFSGQAAPLIYVSRRPIMRSTAALASAFEEVAQVRYSRSGIAAGLCRANHDFDTPAVATARSRHFRPRRTRTMHPSQHIGLHRYRD